MNTIITTIFFMIATTMLYAQDFALKQLNMSPRHHEWVKVNSSGKAVHCFVAYPEKSENAQTVIVIHENRGLTDWVRSLTDQLAAEGYLAIAPDLLSEFNDDIEKTSDFESSDAARNAIYQLDQGDVTQDLDAVYEYIKHVPASNGTVSVMGFCWGGSQTFRYATNNPDLKAALVFYGTAPDDIDQISQIEAPVYGFYGGADQRVNATIEETEKMMKKSGKTYQYKIYNGAGHAFMRRGDDPDGNEHNKNAKKEAWDRVLNILN